MTDYIERPKANTPGKAVAAAYRFGQPLDELRKVARMADSEADVIEVPEWRVVLVRHEQIPDYAPAYVDYDVMQDGQVLVWSERTYSLYVTSQRDFDREWQRES